MTAPVARPWRAGDKTSCLALFDSNLPRFFAPDERAEFETFLDALTLRPAPYLVLERGGRIVACGGLEVEPGGRQASLTWGMVNRALHGQRLGTALTTARLDLARAMPRLERLVLATSQHVGGFYQGLGFETEKITPGGFGPGLDRWDMALDLRA